MTTDAFKELAWAPYMADKEALIVGAGGIGSWLTLFLSRLGLREITLSDFDTLEENNLGGQFFRYEDIGEAKVDIMSQLCVAHSDTYIQTSNSKITEDSLIKHRIIFSAVDNMETRKILFDKWKKNVHYGGTEYWGSYNQFIDARLLAEQFQVFSISRDQSERVEEYEKNHLYDDSQVDPVVCTQKQTSHVAAMCAGRMVSVFTNMVRDYHSNVGIRGHITPPFSTFYNLKSNLYEQEYCKKVVSV